MNQDQLNELLRAIVEMEHYTQVEISREGYWAMVALARECKAPQFVTEYFARKAVTLETV